MHFVQEKIRFQVQTTANPSAPLVFPRSPKTQATLSCFAGYAFQQSSFFETEYAASTTFEVKPGDVRQTHAGRTVGPWNAHWDPIRIPLLA